MQPIRGVILDVGGTLWPERRPESEADHAERAAGIAALLSADLSMARALVQALADGGALQPGAMTQDTCSDICRAAAGLGLTLGEAEAVGVCRAMCLPALGRWQPFPGAQELLAEIKALGFACALLSNATWRDAESYRRDLEDLGLSPYVDGVVTSVETGRQPAECVMVGNSESNDVLPALALAMRAIRVAIEEPRPASSAAQAVAGSLAEVAAALHTLSAGTTMESRGML